MSSPRLTVRTRLALLLAFVNLMLVVAAGYAWYAITRLNEQLEHTIKEHHEVERAADLARQRPARVQGPGAGVEEHAHPRQRLRLFDKHTGRPSPTARRR